jgi:pectinacetylesterase
MEGARCEDARMLRGRTTGSVKPGACSRSAVLCIVITHVLLFLSYARVLQAAGPPEGIAGALSCGKPGVAEGVSPGKDLYRIDIDVSSYPNAVCNDGTPAAMFVRRYRSEPDRNSWIIFLLGGGDCKTGQACAQRWCSIGTNYGADKMSTSFLEERDIAGNGIFSPDSSINSFAGWNQVFVYYCSSDGWSGSASNVPLSAIDPNGKHVDYLIDFRGADIVEAVIGTLQRQPGQRLVTYRRSPGPDIAMPDLNNAERVLFTGSSAGGNGVKSNVDRVGQLLRSMNKRCRGSEACPLAYMGVIDANYPPSYQSVDLTQATFCKGPPFLCAYGSFYTYEWNQVDLGTWGARGDESCVKWHHDSAPGTEWMCADPQHVVGNHLTTPLFIRMDMQDPLFGGQFGDEGLTTPAQFGRLVHDQLLNVLNLDQIAEEGSGKTGGPPLRIPGVFGPQCGQHYGLSDSTAFFSVTVTESGKKYSYHDLLWNWVQGLTPQQAVHALTAPGPAPDCP